MSIPKSVFSTLGNVRVFSDKETAKYLSGKGLIGEMSGTRRCIAVHAGLNTVAKRLVLGHELMHLVIHDSGLDQMMGEKLQEALCDAFGVWLSGAMRAGKVILK